MLEKDQVIIIVQKIFNNFMGFNIKNKNKTIIQMVLMNNKE